MIGEGRDSLVYDIGGGRVLRRYRRPKDTAVEARMMTWAAAHGVRVPEVFDADGSDLVMERIDGRAALDGLLQHPWRLPAVGRLLADMHHRLDAVPAASWMPERTPVDDDVRPGVVHCDLHPDNVMLTADGPVLIDWTRSGAGDRRMDLAQTWLIIAELGMPDDRLGRAVHRVVRRSLLAAFLRRRRPRRGAGLARAGGGSAAGGQEHDAGRAGPAGPLPRRSLTVARPTRRRLVRVRS